MAMAVVQHKSSVNSNTVPGAITLTSTPTSGNVLVAFLGVNLSKSGITIGSGWTLMDMGYETTFTTTRSVVLMRIVQPGDTSTLPAFFTAGSTYHAYCVYEVSGQYGTTVEDALLTVYTRNLPTTANALWAPFPMNTDDNMALSFFGSYNGNTNPSISGSWTLDEAQNNNANYGSIAGAHRHMAIGDVVDGQWTGGSSEPLSSAIVILRSDPNHGLYPRHIFSFTPGGGGSGTITVPWTPKVGNLMLGYLDWQRGSSSSPPTINSGSWTEFAHADNTQRMICALQRTLQIGDGPTTPGMTTAGSDFHAVTIIELDQPQGSFLDHISDKTGYAGSGSSTQTTTSDTTTANGQMAILHSCSYNDTTTISETTPWGIGHSQTNSSNYGSYGTFINWYPTSGTTVQGSLAGLNSGDSKAYVQSIFQAGYVAPVIHDDAFRVNLIESGVPANGVDLVPGLVYGWMGQIFTKNPTNNPITRADFNSMFVQVERTN